MTDAVWKAARNAANDAASRKAGEWLTNNGHAARFAGMDATQWRKFIEAVTDEHAATFEEQAERMSIKAADDLPF